MSSVLGVDHSREYFVVMYPARVLNVIIIAGWLELGMTEYIQRTSALCCGFALHPCVIISPVPNYFIIYFCMKAVSLFLKHSRAAPTPPSFLQSSSKGLATVLGVALKHQS